MGKNRGRLINMNQGNNVKQGQHGVTHSQKPQEALQATQTTEVVQEHPEKLQAPQRASEGVTEEAQIQEQQEHQSEPQNNDSSAGGDIGSILGEITAKKSTKFNKVQVSIYLDEDVHKKYQRFGKKFSKGARSELVNELLRKALEEY